MMPRPPFWLCLATAVDCPEFMEQWARLRGIKLTGSPIEKMVDEATGADEANAKLFIEDVRELIYDRLPE